MNTKEKIEVMQAHLDGKKIEIRRNYESDWGDIVGEPSWLWDRFDYRIAPEPKKSEGRWERMEIKICKGKYRVSLTDVGEEGVDALPRYLGFGGIDYRSPFDPKVIVRSMVPLMFAKSSDDEYIRKWPSAGSCFNDQDRPGIPVAAWFWREEQ